VITDLLAMQSTGNELQLNYN